MTDPLLRCRAAGLELLLPIEGLRHVGLASDLPADEGAVRWNGEEFPALLLHERLATGAEPGPEGAIALYTLDGESFALVADSFAGLLRAEMTGGWLVPRGWLLRDAALPYRRFVALDSTLAAEVALGHLLLPPAGGGEEEPIPLSDTPAGAGLHLVARIGDQRVALPLAELVEVVSDARVVPFPCLPRHVQGLTLHRGTPVPVVALEPGPPTGVVAFLRSGDGVLALALRDVAGLQRLAEPGSADERGPHAPVALHAGALRHLVGA